MPPQEPDHWSLPGSMHIVQPPSGGKPFQGRRVPPLVATPVATPLIFGGQIKTTPPHWDHALLRPPRYWDSGRNFYEPTDMPEWDKHPLVQKLIGSDICPDGDFRAFAQSLYDLDYCADKNMPLHGQAVIAGLILMTLGILNVRVLKKSVIVESSGRDTKWDDVIEDMKQPECRFVVQLLAFAHPDHPRYGNGHWTVAIWDKTSRELYHFDAGGSSDPLYRVEEAWRRLLEDLGDDEGFAIIQAPQGEQGDFECGYLTIHNTYNFFRKPDEGAYCDTPDGEYLCSHKVRSWGTEDYWAWEESYPESRVTEMRNEFMQEMRADIYSFFGYPVDCPLNPHHPLCLQMSVKAMKEGQSSGRWVLWYDNPRIPSKPQQKSLKWEAGVKAKRANEVGYHMRNRQADGYIDWGVERLQRYWFSVGDVAATKFAYKAQCPEYWHAPYGEEAGGCRAEPEGPYPCIFKSTLGWAQPRVEDRIITRDEVAESTGRDIDLSRLLAVSKL